MKFPYFCRKREPHIYIMKMFALEVIMNPIQSRNITCKQSQNGNYIVFSVIFGFLCLYNMWFLLCKIQQSVHFVELNTALKNSDGLHLFGLLYLRDLIICSSSTSLETCVLGRKVDNKVWWVALLYNLQSSILSKINSVLVLRICCYYCDDFLWCEHDRSRTL